MMPKKIAVLILLSTLFIWSSPQAESFNKRFQPYGLNYALPFQSTADDVNAIEVQYGFKYIFFNCNNWKETPVIGCVKGDLVDLNIFFSYLGEFDFYMGSRDSGPVINRVSNPALHFNWAINDVSKYLKWVDLGIEHRSNGQVIDAEAKDEDPTSPTFGQYLTEIAHSNDDDEYFDKVSRGSNYLSLAFGGDLWDRGRYGVSYKIYKRVEESDITWGRLADNNTRFSEYDVLRANVSNTFSSSFEAVREITVELEYTIGEDLLDTDSADVNIIMPWHSKNGGWELPLIIRAHFGPMEKLSDYTASRDSLGVGFAFTY